MSEVEPLSFEARPGLQPRPASGEGGERIALPAPDMSGGLPLMGALWQRKSSRAFGNEALSTRLLGDLLWAADGVNRSAGGGRTAPSPHGLNEIDIYVALPQGLYRYDTAHHRLDLKRAVDARNLTGYRDFVGEAPLDLIYVANFSRMTALAPSQREMFSAVTAGAIAQNVYLYCASAGLGAVVRGWLNHRRLAEAMSLNEDEVPLLAQTVGFPVGTVTQ
ncbi:SagB/ThcOx family dehydrogenase [Cupriavidus basilensis]|uniref:SagB/ThcOx family dehydrogenase n=1 Tax=Cupriavidus basilensis TaxID=68895 RepID=A0ABT6AZY5_9BURK|nr:SagB/ThcOx family dehydrogenase [Cupriavidus basilensis]MDF3838192.1 SagB/ThcOx family dehydrogenase [Cupriavidus basilensis]